MVAALSATLLAFVLAEQLVTGTDRDWAYLVFSATSGVYIAAGLLAWSRRPSNGTGPIILAGGIATALAQLSSSTYAVFQAVGMLFSTALLGVVVHLLHAFPSGRVRGIASQVTVAAGYVAVSVLQIPLYLFDDRRPGSALFIADRPALHAGAVWIQAAVGAGVMFSTGIILLDRLRAANRQQRRILAPLLGYGIFAALYIPLTSGTVVEPVVRMAQVPLAISQLVVLTGVPTAFVLAVLRGGFARTGELQELAVWLGAARGSRSELSAALASVLGDRSLELVYWFAEQSRYVDAVGRPVELPVQESGRGVVTVELDDQRIGGIVYDAGLITEPEVVRMAGRVVAIGFDSERLTVALRASDAALRRSRERLVETADRERRRIAQDLHDGLQVKLVLLALEAQQIAGKSGTSTPETTELATHLRRGIDVAAAELRALVHAVVPASLMERGLTLATEDLVDRLPLPTRRDIGAIGPLPVAVESAAYFVVAESLTNIVKHAEATFVRVRLAQENGLLVIDIIDDGAGGASLDRGTGIRGLVDRIDVIGGRLVLDSPLGVGTSVHAELPVGPAVADAAPTGLRSTETAPERVPS